MAKGGDTPWPTLRWTRASPEAEGMDGSRLEKLAARVRSGRIRNVHSLLLVRRGRLVFEEYFNSGDVDGLHTMQSVSKSVTSALVGIALAKGAFERVGERVLDFFPDLSGIENVDARKRRMTISDLLTMRSGTDYHEGGSGSPHSRLNRMDRGWARFILSRPMISEPGKKFRYDSGAVILTSELLRRRTGVHADKFSEKHLFSPLGIEAWRWFKNAEGHPHTGGGLHLRSRDLAKFGLLYLRGGRWGDRQVVPEAWVRESLSRKVRFARPRGRAVGYGYWWWVLPPDPDGDGELDIYGAFGFMGQYLFLVPEHDLLVVVTAGGKNWSEERAPRDFLYTDVLPARKS